MVLLLTFTVSTIHANPITRQQALKRAAEFMTQQNDPRQLAPVAAKKLAPRRAAAVTTAEPYYVFNRGMNGGFVIVSGDDSTIPVLGYTDSGEFDYTQAPPNLRDLLDDYARQITQIQMGAPVISATIPTHPKVEPLLTCKWSQGYPYNMTCPEYFSLGRSVTGCVATAMAQIMYYHREKSVTEVQNAIPGYTTWTAHPTYGNLKVEGIAKGAPIDWANMKDTYGTASDLQRLAVADLMHYCGVSVKMDYTNSSSGAQSYEVYNALKAYFGYGSSVRYVDYTQVTTDVGWDDVVYTDIAARRPVYVSGSNATVGHAFVADGYDGNLRYHINWGWGGQSDGYYYLTNLTPGQGQGTGGSDDGYNGYKQIIVGIEPENYGEKAMTFTDSRVKTVCLENWDADHDSKLTYNEAAAVTDLGTAFQNENTITKFPELYYFTGLKHLADDAFSGCTKLTSLRLPRKLQTIGARTFAGCQSLSEFVLPDYITAIGAEAFSGCAALTALSLPESITAIEAGTFRGCTSFTSFELPVGIVRLGDGAFAGCTKLQTFKVNTYNPAAITMGQGVFADDDLSAATLHVLQGTKDYFLSTSQWRDFGTIFQARELSGGRFTTIQAGQQYYLYNVGLGRYLTRGEAYNTQAVVDRQPLLFKLNDKSSVGTDVYTITCENSGLSGKYLFRTQSDSNVGKGIKAVFMDGASLDSAYWCLSTAGDAVYTIQIPSGGVDYVAGQYLGVQTSHASNAASPTYGVYYDIDYAAYPQNCLWKFVAYDPLQTQIYNEATALLNLITMGRKQGRNVEQEQAVYDNLDSSIDDIKAAESSLRQKLNLIEFKDDALGSFCRQRWDISNDGELSIAEAAQVKDFNVSFKSWSIVSFDEFQYFKAVPYIYNNTFADCASLTSIILPDGIEKLYYYAFRNCSSLKSINLPAGVNTIGAQCFGYCTALREVTLWNPDPDVIDINPSAFIGVDLSLCTLYVPYGSKALYEQSNVWRNFGTIREFRGKTQPRFSDITTGVPGYLYNVGSRKYVAMGEAYGTQSVVTSVTPISYWFQRSATMPANVYYIQESGSSKVIFRVSTDNKVGDGVKTCFGDGSLSTKAYWQIEEAGDHLFRLSVPTGDNTRVEGEYLGTDESHTSSAASPTYGLYWDQLPVDKRTLWGFVSAADMQEARHTDLLLDKMRTMLDECLAQSINVEAEQAVYDNMGSSYDDINQAVLSLRRKLHYIDFADKYVQAICLANWDINEDGEFTQDEAAQVTDLGVVFQKNLNIRRFEELQYFSSLKHIADGAFTGNSALQVVHLPASVESLGENAFASCFNLKYLVIPHEQGVVARGQSGVQSQVTLFVPAALLDAYADSDWKNKSTQLAYTGIPVVTATGYRNYGRTIGTVNFELSGAPIDGEPAYACDIIEAPTTPVGDYPLTVLPGTITTPGLVCQPGVFTVRKSPLTITALNATREVGQPNPEFELKYKSFRNDETSDVFIKQPVITCDATPESPVGTYEIRVGGAEAQNYEMTYVSGTLTVVQATGIDSVQADSRRQTVFDLTGRRVTAPRRGIYISEGRKMVVK
ncbi:MAG: leucine-rich repeat protein [Prevotella sp.]|nr:leucine-rich repeat protein [Prevotella sp.]